MSDTDLAEEKAPRTRDEPLIPEVVTVPIAALLPGESPRLDGENEEHVARLAEIETPLPPILVDRRTMRVIDGMHRIFAAVRRGRTEIEVEFFDGDRADAFLRAVEANVSHGFPLSQADRRAAAARIMVTHPQLSDRVIARLAGLGAKTVAVIRRSTAAVPRLTTRVGQDGKVRPVSGVAGRERVAEVLARHPGASLREVARLAGVSPATAGDVRGRLARGEAPAGIGHRGATTETRAASHTDIDSDIDTDTDTHAVATGLSPAVTAAVSSALAAATPAVVPAPARRRRAPQQDPVSVVEKLLRDPALRSNEEGRNLLRLLRNNALGRGQWTDLAAAVPPHCGGLVARLAQCYAELWLEFSRTVDERVQSVDREVEPAALDPVRGAQRELIGHPS